MPTPNPYNAAANPDFLSALVAYWLITPGLVAISKAPWPDVAPLRIDPPYCVLTVPPAKVVNQDTRREKQVQAPYQFAVYNYDQSAAAALGRQMTALLDPLHDTKPRFANGYLMYWDWIGESLIEVPEVNKGGARTIWRQMHTYVADIIRPGS